VVGDGGETAFDIKKHCIYEVIRKRKSCQHTSCNCRPYQSFCKGCRICSAVVVCRRESDKDIKKEQRSRRATANPSGVHQMKQHCFEAADMVTA